MYTKKIVHPYVHLEDREVEWVDGFAYLGSVVSSNGRTDAVVDSHAASTFKDFGALQHAIFKDRNLTNNTKWQEYEVRALSILIYGAECWIPLCRHFNQLNSFHHCCIRIILGIPTMQQ